MVGRVLTKERCGCGRWFERAIADRSVEGWFDSELLCPGCGRRPGRYFLRLSGLKVYSEPRSGDPLCTWRQAFRLLEKIRAEVQAGTFERSQYAAREVREYRLGAWSRTWQAWRWDLAARGEMSPRTVRQAESALRRWIVPALGMLDLRDVRQEHVDRFAAGLGELKASTRRNVTATLVAMLRQAERWGRIAKSPRMTRLAPPADEAPSWRWITRAAQERVLAAMPERHRAIFEFLVYQMCRPSEARALMWGDVDLEAGAHGRVVLRGTVIGREYRAMTKTRRARVLPLHPRVAAALRRIKPDLCPPGWFVFQMPGAGPPVVGAEASGRAYHETTMRWQWRRACRLAGVPEITLYAGTRHSSATEALRWGATLPDIGAVLGHSSVRHTQVYAHVDEARLLETLGGEVVEMRRTEEGKR